MYCEKCGKELSKGSSFCDYCGQKVEVKESKHEEKKREAETKEEIKDEELVFEKKSNPLGGYIAWRIILNVLICIFILYIFDVIYGTFETIVLSILVLIYVKLNHFVSNFSYQKDKEYLLLNEDFEKVKSLFKNYKKTEEEVLAKKNVIKIVDKERVKVTIDNVFAIIIIIGVVLTLLGAL